MGKRIVTPKKLVGGARGGSTGGTRSTKRKYGAHTLSGNTMTEGEIRAITKGLRNGSIDFDVVWENMPAHGSKNEDGWGILSVQEKKGLDFLRANRNRPSKWEYGIGGDIEETLSDLKPGETVNVRLEVWKAIVRGGVTADYAPVYSVVKNDADGYAIAQFSYYYNGGVISQYS